MIDLSFFDVFEPTYDQISQEVSALSHDPMTTLNSVYLASFVLQKVVLPFAGSEMERLPLAINECYGD